MIYVTGDVHAYLDTYKFEEYIDVLNEDDYIIVCGDFGITWDNEVLEYLIKYYSKFKCTFLWVDGNHENFDLLNEYKVEFYKGGKVHKINENIIHLMRGQVFEIDGKTFFTFGGGTSIDKKYRQEHVSWWKEEMPSNEEIEEGIKNLEKVNYTVDYVITHSIDAKTLNKYNIFMYKGNKFKAFKDNEILDLFEEKINYKKWYFGHYHFDEEINDKKICLYTSIRIID